MAIFDVVDLDLGELTKRAEALYRIGRRRYHTFDHALDVIRRTDQVESVVGFSLYPAVRLAALYHDAVYEVGAKPSENEERSQLALRVVIRDLCGDQLSPFMGIVLERACDLIRVTAHHLAPMHSFLDWDTMLFMDCDVLGFASSWEDFQKDGAAIAYEHSDVDPTVYQIGRIGFLRRLLVKGVFRSPFLRKRHEEEALRNIRDALAELDQDLRPYLRSSKMDE